MKCFKGFDKDLKCRDFQYEIGKEYTEEKADICNYGFHACEFPMDVFGYYPPSDSRYCEVDLEENDQKSSDDSKRVGKKISVKAEIRSEEHTSELQSRPHLVCRLLLEKKKTLKKKRQTTIHRINKVRPSMI
mgnify:CR=1 FL=1